MVSFLLSKPLNVCIIVLDFLAFPVEASKGALISDLPLLSFEKIRCLCSVLFLIEESSGGASWSVAARVWHPGRVESSCRACWRVHRQRHNPCTRRCLSLLVVKEWLIVTSLRRFFSFFFCMCCLFFRHCFLMELNGKAVRSLSHLASNDCRRYGWP